MPSAIEVAKKEASARVANLTRRYKQKNLEHALVRKASLLTTAAVFGTLDRMKVPVAIAGFPWKLGVASLALLGEGLTKGNVQAIMAGLADSTLAIYVSKSISTNTLIAGIESVGAEHDVIDTDGDEI